MAKAASKSRPSASAPTPPAPPEQAPLDPFTAELVARGRDLISRATEAGRALEALAQPGNADPYLRRLDAWEQLALLSSIAGEAEMDVRKQLFAGAFPNPKEGTNVHKLPDGRELVGKHNITRKIDAAALAPVLAALRAKGVANTDQLVRYKPELAKSEWNSLSDENKLVFSPAVISTVGSPGFEIRIPKKKGSAGA